MPRDNGRSGQADQLSVEDAKLQLLGWSVEADEQLHEQIEGYLQTARAKTRKAVPWAAAGGVLLALLMGARKKRRGRWDRRVEGETDAHRTGWMQTAFRVGMFALPILRAYLVNRGRRY